MCAGHGEFDCDSFMPLMFISTVLCLVSILTKVLRSRRSGERRDLALEKLVDLAISEHVVFVLLAGDLYDGDWRDASTGLFFIAQMSRLDQSRNPRRSDQRQS